MVVPLDSVSQFNIQLACRIGQIVRAILSNQILQSVCKSWNIVQSQWHKFCMSFEVQLAKSYPVINSGFRSVLLIIGISKHELYCKVTGKNNSELKVKQRIHLYMFMKPCSFICTDRNQVAYSGLLTFLNPLCYMILSVFSLV